MSTLAALAEEALARFGPTPLRDEDLVAMDGFGLFETGGGRDHDVLELQRVDDPESDIRQWSGDDAVHAHVWTLATTGAELGLRILAALAARECWREIAIIESNAQAYATSAPIAEPTTEGDPMAIPDIVASMSSSPTDTVSQPLMTWTNAAGDVIATLGEMPPGPSAKERAEREYQRGLRNGTERGEHAYAARVLLLFAEPGIDATEAIAKVTAQCIKTLYPYRED